MINISLQKFYIVFQEGKEHIFEIYNFISIICVCADALIKVNSSFFQNRKLNHILNWLILIGYHIDSNI